MNNELIGVISNDGLSVNVTIVGTGEQGETGKSAYQEWLDQGNEGTIEDFLDSLKSDEYIYPEIPDVDMIVETEDKQFISSDDKSKLYGFVHEQIVSSKTWIVEHTLDKYPSVSVVDTGGSIVVGSVIYISKSQLEVHFTHEFSGKVYLN